MGHACVYLEFPSGLRVLLDPVFEDRCSPACFPGPKRYTPTPCGLADLPIVDVVVISHSHYDHLSYPSVTQLARLHPKALFAVPLGLEQWFRDAGIQSVVELDWWQDVDITLSPSDASGEKSVSATPVAGAGAGAITARISCLPCQHTSARTPFDHAHTLWASWAIASGGKSVWFGGDTGYRAVPRSADGEDDYGAAYADLPRCPAFKDIGRIKGPFDLGLIPIGAYDPRWLFSSVHADPADAVEIMGDTRCKRALGVHWGTWVLTEEDGWAPPKKLKEALRRKGIEEVGVFDVLDVGGSKEF
jgi:N-acyl-phosphatidylethanolamine-hydrolysing phospholipase D